jgi:hypothetical protein
MQFTQRQRFKYNFQNKQHYFSAEHQQTTNGLAAVKTEFLILFRLNLDFKTGSDIY